MAYVRPRIERTNGLGETELVALRGVSNDQIADGPLVRRLAKLGLVRRNLDKWDLTEQGRITLMFAAAR